MERAVSAPQVCRVSNTAELVSDTPKPGSRARPDEKHLTPRRIAYAVTTVIAAMAFAGSGIANLLHVTHVAADMGHLGYPAYFMTILGTWKVLGAIVVSVPGLARAKEWAYAGMIFDVTGA